MHSIDHSILDYQITAEDTDSYNPYLKKLMQLIDENSGMSRAELVFLLMDKRDEFVTGYCFTIPYQSMLKKIASYSPIVEIGAGSGYLARCLSEMGADITAYDSHPPGENDAWEWYRGNPWFEDSWYCITAGDESAAALHPDRALLMAWPMPMSPMAYNALVLYRNAGGKTLIFIGDPHPGSSGDEYFYKMLDGLKIIDRMELFGWPGINEKLLIYSLA